MRAAFNIGMALGKAVGWLIGTLVRVIVNGIYSIFAMFSENRKH